jgi:Protein of unknown function (DUF3800)
MPYSNYIVYVDESGDHGLARINPQNPVFALTFCVFEKPAYRQAVVPIVQELKFDYWGHDAVVLRSYDIRNQRGDFRILSAPAVRAAFMDRLNAIVDGMPLTVIAAAIDKPRLVQRYVYPSDPYPMAMTFCMERLQMFLIERGQQANTTHLLVECRGEKEDKSLELVFRRVCDGANFVGAMPNLDIHFMDKKHNSTGLQIADLVAYPIARHTVDPAQLNRAYEIVETKLRRGPMGQVQGYGLKVFP